MAVTTVLSMAAAILLVLPCRAGHCPPPADLVLRGGKIVTLDPRLPVAEALAASGGRIVAVGTTALRILETAARQDGTVPPFAGETNLFILPGYRFKVVDLLLTNFHLPRSTLFMLVAAFAGLERMKKAYEHAKAQGYRFFSYGDAMLIV